MATLLWLFFDQTFGRFFRCLASLCCENKIVVHPENTSNFSDHAKTMNVLSSYNIRNNPKMKNIILNLEKYLVEDK